MTTETITIDGSTYTIRDGKVYNSEGKVGIIQNLADEPDRYYRGFILTRMASPYLRDEVRWLTPGEKFGFTNDRGGDPDKVMTKQDYLDAIDNMSEVA